MRHVFSSSPNTSNENFCSKLEIVVHYSTAVGSAHFMTERESNHDLFAFVPPSGKGINYLLKFIQK